MDARARDLKPRASRRHGWVRFVLRALLLLALLVVALPPALLVALRFEAPRAFVAKKLDPVLAPLFRGRLRIETIERVDLGGARVSGSIEDPTGLRVVRFRSVTVHANVPTLVYRVLQGGGVPSVIDIDEVRIPHAEVTLVDDGHGTPTLAHAFDPRTPSAPTPSAAPTPTPVVNVRSLTLEHAWVHGKLASTPLLDADVTKLRAKLGLDPTTFQLELTDAGLASRLEPYALNPRGKLSGELRVPLGAGVLSLKGNFTGFAADTALVARATLDGERVDAEAHLPALNRQVLQRLVPGLALRGTLDVRARAKGTFRELDLSLAAKGAAGELESQGRLSLQDPLRLRASAEGRRWDVSALTANTPETHLDFDAEVTLESKDRTTTGRYALALHRPRVAREALPDVTTQGTFSSSDSRLTVGGDARLEEPGARAKSSYALQLAGERGTLETSVDVDLSDPPRLVALASARVHGRLTGRARVRFPDAALNAVVDAKIESVERGADRLGATRAHLELEGPVAAPCVRGTLSIARAHAAGRDLSSVSAKFAGTPQNAHLVLALNDAKSGLLTAATDVHATGTGVVLENTSATLLDREGTLGLKVARADLSDARIQVDDLALDGAGVLRGSFSLEGEHLRVSAQTKRLDLVRLATVAGLSTPFRRARTTMTLELERTHVLEARIQGELEDLSYGSVENGRAALELEARADAWSGTIGAELVPGARLTIDLSDFRVAELLAPRAGLPTGGLHATGTLDLGRMAPLFASIPSAPVESAKGRIDLAVDYRHETPSAVPTLTARVRTHDLALVEKRAPSSAISSSEEAIQAAPSVLTGIDFGIDLALDAPTRKLTAHVGVYDERAELLNVDASAGPWPDDSLDQVAARARSVPLEVHATMPARKLAELPRPIRPLSLRGRVGADLVFDGTIDDPHLVVDVRGSRLAATGQRVQGEMKPRYSVIGHVEYRKQGGDLALVADAKGGRALDAKFRWTGDAVRAALDPAARTAMTVSGGATLDELDLESIPALKNRQIEGIVSGTAEVEYGPAKRALRAELLARPLRTGQATLDRVSVSLDAAPGHLASTISVEGQSGSLTSKVDSGLTWPEGGTPALDGDITAALSARNFRLASLHPLVSGQINELDGRLDVDMRAKVHGENVELRGSGRLSDGVVQVPMVGQRLDAISARIRVDSSAIVIKDLRANGVTGRVTGGARLELDQHLALRRLEAHVDITKNQKLPVTVQGVPMGDAWGKVQVEVVNEPARVAVRVRVPDMHLELPDTDRNGVQDLEPDEKVRVGVYRADAAFVALPTQPIEKPEQNPTPVEVTVELGSVWLRKGDLVNAELTGALHVTSAETAQVTGRIDLKGGSLDVSGKRFEIERGTVTFTGGDPANPTIFAMARWDAPASYSVTATYTGTAQKGNLTLNAEPPLTQEEIVNLILFGSPEGSVASGSGGTAAGAVGLAGSTATRGFNRAMSDFTHLDVQARVDTSSGSARPELMIPLTPRLSARVSRAIGEPSPGSSPDRTFLTLELRLKRNWALSALLGDRGASALDLVWRRHY